MVRKLTGILVSASVEEDCSINSGVARYRGIFLCVLFLIEHFVDKYQFYDPSVKKSCCPFYLEHSSISSFQSAFGI